MSCCRAALAILLAAVLAETSAATRVHSAPRNLLLQAGRQQQQHHHQKEPFFPPDFFTESVPRTERWKGAEVAHPPLRPKAPGFFTEDAVHQAKMPDHSVIAKNKTCHPTCSWSCGQSECTNTCKPICKPPKCVTACQRPIISACQQKCEDPQCAVICPPQCSTGTCPECKTVCNEPKCHLDCGQARKCETRCADPICTFLCTPDKSPEACPKPACEMKCETPALCSLEPKKETLREVYHGYVGDASEMKVQDAVYTGKEIGWTGLAKVPMQELHQLVPQRMVGSEAIGGSLPVEGAKPMMGAMDSFYKQNCEKCQGQESQ